MKVQLNWLRTTGVTFLAALLGIPVAQAQETSDDAVLEEILVKGTRGSLRLSLDQKRNAIGVVDAITADDIGKFPDLNIGEALGRVPGITITRSPGGEGAQVSVRGGQTDWTKTTVNGLSVATGNTGREFDFDIFASELFTNVTVYKSPSADLTEGGVTATIDLTTPKPFELGDRIAFSAAGSNAAKDNGDNFLPRVSGLVSKRWENVGALFSVSYSETGVRGDISEGWGWDNNNDGLTTYLSTNGVDANGDPIARDWATDPVTVNVNGVDISDQNELLNLAANTITPLLPRLGPQLVERERLGLTGAFQADLSDNVQFSADILYAEFTQDEIRATIDGLPGFNIGREWTRMTIENGIAVAGAVNNQVQRSETLFRQFDTELVHTTLGLDWQIDDTWSAAAVLGRSSAEESELSRTFLFSNTGTWEYDFVNPRYPQIGGVGFDWLNPADYTPEQLRYRPFERDDEENSFSLDFVGDLNDTGLVAIRTGLQFRDREKGQTRIAEVRVPFAGNFSDYAIPVSSLGGDYHSDSPYPSDFLIADVNLASADFLPDGFSTDIDALQTYSVSEETIAAYFRADLDLQLGDMPLAIDAGFRYVSTDVSSSGSQQEESGPVPVTIDGEYSDWLPALNASLDVSDEFKVRLAANRTMTRPTLSDIAPAVRIFPTVLAAQSGNPNLEPFRSNNLDLSFEWYFDNEALLSVTYYRKEIETFIVREARDAIIQCGDIRDDNGENVCGRVFSVTTPVNGESGELSGFEVQYQQPFTFLPAPFDGLGVMANATFSDSEREGSDGQTRPLVGQSDESYNVVAYYDKERLGARLAYTYRSGYLNPFFAGRNGFDVTYEDYAQLDMSLRFDINDNYSLFFEGLNILEEDTYRFYTTPGNDFGKMLNQQLSAQGRVLQFGVRGTF